MGQTFLPVALVLLLSAAWAAADSTPGDASAHPPIPVHFTLAEPGFVTLVIEDSRGIRVRNLISETSFPKGENIVWWDGLDDLGRNTDAARHAVYHVPGKLLLFTTTKGSGRVRLRTTRRSSFA